MTIKQVYQSIFEAHPDYFDGSKWVMYLMDESRPDYVGAAFRVCRDSCNHTTKRDAEACQEALTVMNRNKKMSTSARVETFIVARSKFSETYAIDGQRSEIGSTGDIMNAKRFGSSVEIMTWMGGHYKGYDAVEVKLEFEVSEIKKLKYPSEDGVWDD